MLSDDFEDGGAGDCGGAAVVGGAAGEQRKLGAGRTENWGRLVDVMTEIRGH